MGEYQTAYEYILEIKTKTQDVLELINRIKEKK
jgi:hypothetical protein